MDYFLTELPMYSPEGEVSDIMGIMDAGHISDSVEMMEELSVDFVLTMHDLKYLQKMEKANEYIIEDDYHVSYGLEWAESPFDLESLIKSAEDKTCEAKREYHKNY